MPRPKATSKRLDFRLIDPYAGFNLAYGKANAADDQFPMSRVTTHEQSTLQQGAVLEPDLNRVAERKPKPARHGLHFLLPLLHPKLIPIILPGTTKSKFDLPRSRCVHAQSMMNRPDL